MTTLIASLIRASSEERHSRTTLMTTLIATLMAADGMLIASLIRCDYGRRRLVRAPSR